MPDDEVWHCHVLGTVFTYNSSWSCQVRMLQNAGCGMSARAVAAGMKLHIMPSCPELNPVFKQVLMLRPECIATC